MPSVEEDPIWKQIDSSDYLYLQRVFEPRDNSLTIVLEEAMSNLASAERAKLALAKLPDALSGGESTLIESTDECRVFTLTWKSYVSYCVTEEMHGSCGHYEHEQYTGRLLRLYSQSNFLDFIAKDTGAHSQPYKHYKIACLNHIIDIASVCEPALASQPFQARSQDAQVAKNGEALVPGVGVELHVGSYKSFGPWGPKYEVIGPAEPRRGRPMARIIVLESGEELDYPLEDILSDPEAT